MKIINVMAVSIDGKIAAHSTESEKNRIKYGFVNARDKKWVKDFLLQADAVITGANSIRSTQKVWEQKNKKDKFPIWVVFTNKGLNPRLKFFQQKLIPRWVISKSDIGKKGVINYLSYGKNLPGRFLVEKLKKAKCKTVLLFGGSHINQIFYQENLVDELALTLCPVMIGKKNAPSIVFPQLREIQSFSLISSQVVGNHVFLKYKVRKNLPIGIKKS